MYDISHLPKPIELDVLKFEPSEPAGDKAPILICPGLTSSRNNWVQLAPRLAEATKRIAYVFDCRDHGDIRNWTNEFSLFGIVSDVMHFLNQNALSSFVGVGHSLGGMAFSRLATLYPGKTVEKLVMIDIQPTKRYPDPQHPLWVMLRLCRQVLDTLHEEKIVDVEQARRRAAELFEQAQIQDEAAKQSLLSKVVTRNGKIDLRFNLASICKSMQFYQEHPSEDITVDYDGPVLEIYGDESPYFDPATDVEAILKMMPNCKFVRIEKAGHVLPFTHPEQFLSAVIAFLNE